MDERAYRGFVVTTLAVSFQPDSGTTEVVTTIFSHLPSIARTLQTFCEAIDNGHDYRFLIHDRDSI